jgi:hypothetical protein
MDFMKLIEKVKQLCKENYIFYKDDRISPEIGTIYEFAVPFYMYVGTIHMGFVSNKKIGCGAGGANKNQNFNIEHYEGKFIRLSIFKGTWLVQSVYDGGYAGRNYVTVIRQDLLDDYKEWVPLLKLVKEDEN